jgi:L-malate glycosyltransferase
MQIVQLVTRRQRRGAEVFATELADALHVRGHDVTVVGLQPPHGDVLTPRNAAGVDLGVRGGFVLHSGGVRQLAQYLRSRGECVVQANGGFAMKYAVLARRWARGSWPIVYRNIGLSSDWLTRPGQRWWNRWLMRQVDAAAAVSEASRRDLIRSYGLDPERVRVVRRGVPVGSVVGRSEGRAALTAAGIPEDAFVLLHVGSFTPEKNHEGLLRILERVRAEVGHVHLALVGDGPLRGRVEAAAPPHVHFLGVRTDVPALMAGADVFVLPSLTEGLPGVVLEAAVQHLPAVAYDVGGVSEVVRDGETGRLIASGDESHAAAALLDLVRRPVDRHALAASAHQMVLEQYSLDRSTDAFEALYRGVASCGAVAAPLPV